MTQQMVPVYDTETRTVTNMPASELASGMIRVQVVGVGEVWVDSSKLKPSTAHNHPPFDGELKQQMRLFHETFADVYPMSPEGWEDGFRRDLNMHKEIGVWANIAGVFRHFTSGRDLSREQRKDIFDVVLVCFNNGPDHVLATVRPLTLSKKRVLEIVEEIRRRAVPPADAN